MTTTILCAIDERSEPEVARTAGDLTAGLGSQLVTTHVARDAPALAAFLSRAQRERRRHRAIERGRSQLRRARELLPEGLKARERVELGSPLPKLLEIARDENAELIVVGSRGRGAVLSAIFGSVSRALVERAPCPVVIVTPGAAKYQAGRSARSSATIVCGIDGSEPSLGAARLTADLAERLGDRPLLLHAYDARSRRKVSGLSDTGTIAPEGADLRRLTESWPPAYALESVANRERARLIVVGARSIGRLRAALLPSVSAQLAGVAGCPVVVLPENAELGGGSGHYEVSQAA